MAIHITMSSTIHITLHITLHVTLHVHSPHPLSTSPTPHIQPHNHPHHSPHNHPRNNKNLLTLRHSILTDHVAAVSQAHCIVNLERMVERSLEPVKILVLRLAPLNLAER